MRVSTEPYFSVKSMPGNYFLPELINKFPTRYPFLLESTAQSLERKDATARFDILMAFPQQVLRKTWQGQLYLDNQLLPETNFLSALNQLYHADAIATDLPLPFCGGWFLYLGYELVNEIEPGLNLPNFSQDLPVASAVRIPAAIIYDHHLDTTLLVTEKEYEYCLEYMRSDLQMTCAALPQRILEPLPVDEEPVHIYIESVRRVLDYIRDGDVFQVNLSRQWSMPAQSAMTPNGVYLQLRQKNPAPFSAFGKINNTHILSSSPERLIHVKNGRVQTRPIAGTRPRSHDVESDRQLQEELISNSKERAEHVMLIDLERNDLGRVCKPGSIHVDEMMVIESYAHVHHIVSNVSGELQEGIGPGDIIAAVFPGGTITGCPKVRCMEIIQELEQSPRGAYTGSLGYLNRNGDMDLNILIRTIVMNEKMVTIRAGAGLVADSNPERELEETRSKAKGMLQALIG